jgi:cytochrome P450
LSGGFLDAGAKTTISFIESTILALVAYPEYQRKIQAEIDTALGGDTMPGFDDLEQLPYLKAFMQEVLRLRPVGPVALPHVSREDLTVRFLLLIRHKFSANVLCD